MRTVRPVAVYCAPAQREALEAASVLAGVAVRWVPSDALPSGIVLVARGGRRAGVAR